ncbi:MAG TPA: AraC family transcriptional regulator [Planctomycetota bacterium]|nr:AraC family transcriptional regulator [Planctomycetota bacterium]
MYGSARAPRLVAIGRMAFRPGHTVRPHAHPFTEMLVMFTGAMRVRVGPAEVSAEAGDVLVYPPRTPHAEAVSGPAPAEFICAAVDGPLGPGSPAVPDRTGRIRLLAGWMADDLRLRDDARRDVAGALLPGLLAELSHAAAGSPAGLVAEVRAYLREKLAGPVTVGELAARAHMGRAHFIRTYKRLAGRTPMQELRAMRAEAARDLIIGTGLPLKAIAPQVGFCDEYHLSKVVRQVLGTPPGHFRWRCADRKPARR